MDMTKACWSCEHCTRRHLKENINTDGNYICLVMGSLLAPGMENTCACGGLYYDRKAWGLQGCSFEWKHYPSGDFGFWNKFGKICPNIETEMDIGRIVND